MSLEVKLEPMPPTEAGTYVVMYEGERALVSVFPKGGCLYVSFSSNGLAFDGIRLDLFHDAVWSQPLDLKPSA